MSTGVLLNVNDYFTKCQWVQYYTLIGIHRVLNSMLSPVTRWAQERHSEESTGFRENQPVESQY